MANESIFSLLQAALIAKCDDRRREQNIESICFLAKIRQKQQEKKKKKKLIISNEQTTIDLEREPD